MTSVGPHPARSRARRSHDLSLILEGGSYGYSGGDLFCNEGALKSISQDEPHQAGGP
jgi:hypothetical protein